MSDKPRRRYLGVIEGGRAQLERQALRAIAFDFPEAQEWVRRLTSSANHTPIRLIEGKLFQPSASEEGAELDLDSNHQ